MRPIPIIIFISFLSFLFFLSSCKEKRTDKVVTPWGEVLNDSISDYFTVSDIVNNGEMIILTLSGPESYYDYHGRGMGTQYLLCERFAHKMGVSLRVELCKDTAEMVSRLNNGDADLIAFLLPKVKNNKDSLLFCGARIDSLNVQWAVAEDSKELADSLNSWFKPELFAEVKKEESYLLSSASVKRHVYAPFQNKKRGVISSYDNLFKKYAPTVRWDWRLMAAQCYQESCFDPKARSWAGARGLMQIMPSTAAELGLSMSAIHEPEPNIKAATRYIQDLTQKFNEVPNFNERQLFVLAAYNGGYFHIQDAMALAQKNGKNPHKWKDVAYYVLALQQPRYYNDPIVKWGYMRGSETVNYVDRIRELYAQYRGVRYDGNSVSTAPSLSSPRPTTSNPSTSTDPSESNTSTQPSKSSNSSTTPTSPSSPYTPQKAKKKRRYQI
ncbi:MAG: transglycosylase SLT domain-containing protein [Prevotella sp.]|nr:transglycosylase SLT domain-containing protein [Prevotella sp.]